MAKDGRRESENIELGNELGAFSTLVNEMRLGDREYYFK